MAKDPVLGPVSRPLDPKPEPPAEEPEAEEVQPEDKEVHTEVAEEAELEEALEEEEEVQLEEEQIQTYESELRTELTMRPIDDLRLMAQSFGIKFKRSATKEDLANLILKHEGFEPTLSGLSTDMPEERDGEPRYSVRVRRALESQGKL